MKIYGAILSFENFHYQFLKFRARTKYVYFCLRSANVRNLEGKYTTAYFSWRQVVKQWS